MAQRLFLPFALLGLLVAAFAGYQWARSNVAQDIYRDRLIGLQDDYRALAQRYNQAVTPRPVTELLVEDGIVCLGVRKGDGELVRIPTDFDVRQNQVYVDYLIVDQRLLIRRAFEFHPVNAVPADKVVYVDQELLDIEWDPERIPYGKALSCRGLEDGRYIISVTGDGSLGMKQIALDAAITLQTHPPLEEFHPVDEQTKSDIAAIGIGDVWKHMTD